MSGRSDRDGGAIGPVHELVRDGEDLSCSVIFAMRDERRAGGDGDGLILARMNLEPRAFDEIVARIRRFVEKRLDWDAVKLGGDGDEGDGPAPGSYYVEDAAAVTRPDRYSGGPDDEYRALDGKSVPRLVAVTFVIEGPRGSAAFTKKFTPGKVITEKRPHFTLAKAVIDVEDDDVVDLPEKYDCCLHGDDMLIFDRPNFEDLFGYHEQHAGIHRQVFGHWRSGADYEIAGLDKYEAQTASDPTKMRKFRAIRDREIYRWEFARIRAFLRGHPVDGIEVRDEPPRIAFKSVYTLLHFFNDAHLTSGATNRRYLATSKREEGGAPGRGATQRGAPGRGATQRGAPGRGTGRGAKRRRRH